jgi:hypothetical protein
MEYEMKNNMDENKEEIQISMNGNKEEIQKIQKT